ncbi:hypothetical protein A2334_02440 [Candidatus Roizmanbacteria bacterium RIFOXYB2_FULL_38_10]|uniref:Uncharacterized protein n=1 Tax=Candidatus Roizmanbacteria bacterium RIFOXYD1_FULL_38_12 TaxID=1802093 RepID=A0A1F7L040_9BACT|nr:MAG: hypothetical protein A3K47_01530 [Candidatus Roizmanbacteria bacterium RIFOXYA2_FULL_38_14]OGK63465.1 MAG: hypothetical protein A3K27_01530 [Candidatus Roizmanbacteria bacterium RIFOXYA1_FULL_37_12]OGK65311.1 MAG: hypothetical protein A3K38_01530 [Candidatus Roizmanbacteria bacterium RIFOXYB1_FULL_40_23]OGK67975.1 MAG: hypothetical protein A2334_02440 [Candidatus Roizmanbacteria bacterium RIFOXYB2_FULL_38_10]OGK69716.1 MAG: hypothetical protein A3K21_01535 [Candidatus Roizmanbacteria ba
MKIQIVEKLKTFLNKHNMDEEHEVVYLMVELRKLLDREREESKPERHSLVRFHADWVVHTKKDHITKTMKEIMMRIDQSIDTYPKDGNIDFLLLPEFKNELINLLDVYGLPSVFCKNDDKWLGFIVNLAAVLADQPIVNPTPNIAEFRYVDIKREGIMANIDFTGDRAGFSITLGFGV